MTAANVSCAVWAAGGSARFPVWPPGPGSCRPAFVQTCRSAATPGGARLHVPLCPAILAPWLLRGPSDLRGLTSRHLQEVPRPPASPRGRGWITRSHELKCGSQLGVEGDLAPGGWRTFGLSWWWWWWGFWNLVAAGMGLRCCWTSYDGCPRQPPTPQSRVAQSVLSAKKPGIKTG